LASAGLLVLLAAAAPAAGPVRFRTEVMAVLSRAGCNAGACHGSQNGKNGFKLSLRGQDPDFDFAALTRDALGRRTDPLRPADSLLLAKATAAVPHEGGKRFDRHSPEYALLAGWIAGGLRPDPPGAPALLRIEVTPAQRTLVEPEAAVPLHVRAFFSDGGVRDVTRLTVFEPSNLAAEVDGEGVARRRQLGEIAVLVRYLNRQATAQLTFVPARPGFAWREVAEANFIDRHVFAKLRALRMNPSALAPDPVFLRRVFLDTLGVLPSPDEARRFLADARPDKRARLIDDLLGRPDFADFWALKWSDLLRSEEKVLDKRGVVRFHAWIRAAILDGRPLNEFARELLAGRGSTYSHPAANYYRALRDPQARAEATAQVFLGLRLQCARCHNHPFDRWTQDDYHSLAACFARVQYRIVSNDRRDKFDLHEFDGEQVVWVAREGEVLDPRTGRPLAPRFPGSAAPACGPRDDRLRALADWVAAPDNPFFARAQVNRVWAHLLGRGIVDPLDDFRDSNPPANGPLLDALVRDFAAHRFDLRHLVRTILNSRTYQLSAVPNDTNREDETNFSHALVRPLQAEQLLDAVTAVTGAAVKFPGFPAGTRAGQLPGVRSFAAAGQAAAEAEQFLASFGKPMRLLGCECERSEDTTLNQAFQLITGPLVNRLLGEPDNRLGRLLACRAPLAEAVEELYLAALSRTPSPAESARALEILGRGRDRRAALEDLAWGLLNAKAFLLRQ
jgi:hypothetical protein